MVITMVKDNDIEDDCEGDFKIKDDKCASNKNAIEIITNHLYSKMGDEMLVDYIIKNAFDMLHMARDPEKCLKDVLEGIEESCNTRVFKARCRSFHQSVKDKPID